MNDNEELKSPYYGKPEYRYLPFTGRYLIFGNTTYYASSGQEGIIGCVNTLQEVEAFILDKRSFGDDLSRIVLQSSPNQNYSGIDILDMDERRFIDINELTFEKMLLDF